MTTTKRDSPPVRVRLTMEAWVLTAARAAAQEKKMSLSEWVSRAAWYQAVAEAERSNGELSGLLRD